jgi:hypothetical protein
MCTSQKDMEQEEENRNIIMLENEVKCSHEDIIYTIERLKVEMENDEYGS